MSGVPATLPAKGRGRRAARARPLSGVAAGRRAGRAGLVAPAAGLVALVALAVLAAGCATPSPPVLTDEVRARTKTIETTTLEEKLTAPPQTLSEAEKTPPPILTPRKPAERMTFDIAEVRKAVLENNLGLAVQLTRPSITREQLEAERAKFEPSLFAHPRAGRVHPDPGNAVSLGGPSTTGSGDVGLQLPLRTGGTAQLSLSSAATGVDGPGTPAAFDSSLGFSISQPLLRGAGTTVSTASIKVAELQHSQEEARTKVAIIGTLAGAETSYWQLYAAERVLEVRYQQYERAREQKRQAERLSEAGVVPAIEVLRAQAGVTRRVESIIVAENTRRQAERELKRLMNIPGLGLDSPTAVVTATDPRPIRLEVDASALARDAVKNRMELLDLELQLAIDAVTVDVARNQELPLLDVDYRYAYLGSSRSFGRSLDRVLSRDFRDWQVGLSIEVPLGNRAARAQRRRAALQRALTLSTRADREQTIRQEVLDAADNLSEAWQRILAARQETLYAARTYEGERKLFMGGVRTSTDVLDALDFLADAQVREVQALAGYEIAKIDLAVATGDLLGYGSIHMESYTPGQPEAPDGAPYRLKLSAAAPGNPSPDPLSPELLHEVASIVARARAGHAGGSGPAVAPTIHAATDPVKGVGTARPQPDAPSSDPEHHAGRPARAREATPAPGSLAAGLRGADPELYTVQVMSGLDEGAVRAFVARSGLAAAQVAYFASRVGGRVRYGVVYGLYPDLTAARAAVTSLPPGLQRRHPWVRRVGRIQSLMVD